MNAFTRSAVGLCVLALATAPALAQPAPDTDRLVVRSLNICLAGADGADVTGAAQAQGYSQTDHTFWRRIQDRWTFFRAWPVETGRAGVPGFTCTMSVKRPIAESDDPRFVSGPVLGNADYVLERLTSGPASFRDPFHVTYLRQPHPDRPGHRRSHLARVQGPRVEVLYLEEGVHSFELVYFRGPKGEVGSQQLIDAVTDPALDLAVHQQISREAKEDFCARSATACHQYIRRRTASESTRPDPNAVYLRGYKPGAYALSALEQDYYANKGYTIRRSGPGSR